MDIFPSIMGYTLSLLLLQDRVPIHVWLSLLYYSCFWCIYLSTDSWHILMDYSCIACTLVGSLLYMSMFDCLDIYTSHSVRHTHILFLGKILSSSEVFYMEVLAADDYLLSLWQWLVFYILHLNIHF